MLPPTLPRSMLCADLPTSRALARQSLFGLEEQQQKLESRKDDASRFPPVGKPRKSTTHDLLGENERQRCVGCEHATLTVTAERDNDRAMMRVEIFVYVSRESEAPR
jgi:hypothetical protein